MEVHYEPFSHQHRVEIKGAISHQGVLGSDPLGNITRIDNVIDGLEKVLENEKAELSNTQKQLEIAKEQLQKPFSREDELKQKEARLSELNALLNVDKKENEIVNDDNEIVNDSPQRNEVDRDFRWIFYCIKIWKIIYSSDFLLPSNSLRNSFDFFIIYPSVACSAKNLNFFIAISLDVGELFFLRL